MRTLRPDMAAAVNTAVRKLSLLTTSNVLQRAQDYINGLKQINDAFVEDIAHKNKMILDKGKRQFKKLTKM